MRVSEEAKTIMLETLAASMGAPHRTRFIATLLDEHHEPMSEPAEFEGTASLNSGGSAVHFEFAELWLKTTRAAFCHVCRVRRADNAEVFVELPVHTETRADRILFMPFAPRVSYDQ